MLSQEEGIGRQMPAGLRAKLMPMKGGKQYLPVAYRLVWFRSELPDWGITTCILEGGQEAGFVTVQATIMAPDGRVIAQGLKTETKQDFPAGWVEKAETGAIGRALALAGYGTQYGEDFAEAPERPADSPVGGAQQQAAGSTQSQAAGSGQAQAAGSAQPHSDTWAGPGQCPRCHAPEGKRHGKPCNG